MRIEGERLGELPPSHRDERDGVHETQQPLAAIEE
jgi:hypothetical protein